MDQINKELSKAFYQTLKPHRNIASSVVPSTYRLPTARTEDPLMNDIKKQYEWLVKYENASEHVKQLPARSNG